MNVDQERFPNDPASCLDHDAPECRLMLAILEDALATFRRGLARTSCAEIQSFREVDRWFRSDESDWPFAFESICSTLRIDAGYVRLGLNRIRAAAFLERPGGRDRTGAELATRRRGKATRESVSRDRRRRFDSPDGACELAE